MPDAMPAEPADPPRHDDPRPTAGADSGIPGRVGDMTTPEQPQPASDPPSPVSHTPEQFVRLLEPERDALWRFAARMSWDRATAEDSLQEAVMIAYRKFETFTLGTSFKAWMFRILANVILNANHRTRRHLQRHVSPERLDLIESLEREQVYQDVLADPDQVLEHVTDPVRRAVQSLPPHERMVFLLRAAEGFRYKEIAALLDIPMGTVMSHLFRARGRLRETLADYARTSGFVRDRDR